MTIIESNGFHNGERAQHGKVEQVLGAIELNQAMVDVDGRGKVALMKEGVSDVQIGGDRAGQLAWIILEHVEAVLLQLIGDGNCRVPARVVALTCPAERLQPGNEQEVGDLKERLPLPKGLHRLEQQRAKSRLIAKRLVLQMSQAKFDELLPRVLTRIERVRSNDRAAAIVPSTRDKRWLEGLGWGRLGLVR